MNGGDTVSKWQEMESKYFMHTVNRVPVTLVKGEGASVWDDNGREYLDFVAGWAVNSLGHCHPVVAKALAEQAHTLIQVSNQFYTIPQIQLAELLVQHSCLDKVFISNSGAEANEGAVKLAQRYGKHRLKGAYEVISATGSFHGRTLSMVAASGQAKHQEPYRPLPAGFINVEYNNVAAVKSATTNKTCAVILEPLQGEGGVNVPDDHFPPHQSVDRVSHLFERHEASALEAGHLAGRVATGVGSPRAGQAHLLLQDAAEGLLELSLYGAKLLLPLPAVEAGAVVFKDQPDIRQSQTPLRRSAAPQASAVKHTAADPQGRA